MAEGTIKRITDRGFGFIDTGSDEDMFFHSSDLEGVSYEELRRTTSLIYRRTWTERAESRKRHAGLTELSTSH